MCALSLWTLYLPSVLHDVFKGVSFITIHFQHAEELVSPFKCIIQYKLVLCRKWTQRFLQIIWSLEGKAWLKSQGTFLLILPVSENHLAPIHQVILFFTLEVQQTFTFFFFQNLHVCTCCLQVCEHECSIYRGQKGNGSHGTAVTDGCEPLCGFWGQNLGLLQDQEALLTTEPSAQPSFNRL